jgi:predicted phage-related endonuclease
MINQSDKDILNRYAEIKRDIKMLEEKADELNPKVVEIMELNDVGEVEIADLGKLALGSRRTWKYSREVEEEDKQVKEHKKLEEQTSAASYTEKSYVIFKTNKE